MLSSLCCSYSLRLWPPAAATAASAAAEGAGADGAACSAACSAAAAAAPSSAAKLGPAVATGGAAMVSSVVDCDDALPLARFGWAAADALALARDCAARIARVISSSSSSSSSSPSSSHAIEAAAPNTAHPEPPDERGLSTVIWRACTDSDADGCTLLAVWREPTVPSAAGSRARLVCCRRPSAPDGSGAARDGSVADRDGSGAARDGSGACGLGGACDGAGLGTRKRSIGAWRRAVGGNPGGGNSSGRFVSRA